MDRQGKLGMYASRSKDLTVLLRHPHTTVAGPCNRSMSKQTKVSALGSLAITFSENVKTALKVGNRELFGAKIQNFAAAPYVA